MRMKAKLAVVGEQICRGFVKVMQFSETRVWVLVVAAGACQM
jgi:hypothetical protein